MHLRSRSSKSSVSSGLVFSVGVLLLLLLSTFLYAGWGVWALLGIGIGGASGGLGLLYRYAEEDTLPPDRTERRLRYLEAIAAQGEGPASAPGHSPAPPAR